MRDSLIRVMRRLDNFDVPVALLVHHLGRLPIRMFDAVSCELGFNPGTDGKFTRHCDGDLTNRRIRKPSWTDNQ